MVKETLVLPLFNDATLAEVKAFMSADEIEAEYICNDNTVDATLEVVFDYLNKPKNGAVPKC